MSWSFPRLFWGRSAGFPADLLLALRCERTCEAHASARALADAVAQADASLATMLRDASALNQPARTAARRLRRALRRQGTLPETPELALPDTWAAIVARRRDLLAQLTVARHTAETVASDEVAATRLRLAGLMRDDKVLTAAMLSSRSLARAFARTFSVAAPPLAGRPPARHRATERRAVLFLQRLAGKNEMLSFLGPCLWGQLAADRPTSVVPTEEALRSLTFFEYWAVRAFTRLVETDPEILKHCRPRMNPACALEGNTLYYPIAHRSTLEPHQVQVLRACDGRSLVEVRAEIAASGDSQAPEALEEFLQRGIIDAHIALPAVDPNPEAHVREFLESVPANCPTKAKWIAALDRLCALRDTVARAKTSAERAAAEQELDRSFHDLTGHEPERGAGKIYGARFVTYQDCARPVELTLGRAVHDDLQQLSPLLDLASWIARASANDYERKLLPVYRRLAAGLDSVDFIRFVRETKWVTDPPEVQARVRGQIVEAWQQRLGDRLPLNNTIELEPDDFRAVVASLPPTTTGPWVPAGDIHSISVLIAAASSQALQRDDYQLVLGKLYKGVPMLIHPAARPFCPDPAAIDAELTRWLRQPLMQLVDPPGGYHRSNLNLPDSPNIYEALTPDAWSRYPAERTLATGELEVTEDDGHLYVRTRDGRLQMGLMSVRWSFLQGKLLGVEPFPFLDEPNVPRITMGRWILARQQWTVPTGPLVTAAGRSESLLGVRDWQHELGLPDLVFVRSPDEPKAIFIDLRSGLYTDVLLAMARRVPSLTISEMAPTPDQAWLSDHNGNYMCEVRLTAVSQESPHSRSERQ